MSWKEVEGSRRVLKEAELERERGTRIFQEPDNKMEGGRRM